MLKIFFTKHLTLLMGLLLTSLIFVTNYQQNTHLMGWDNLQTELSPWLGVKRAFFGVWQEYQSFGLLAGLSHPADLVRAIFEVFLLAAVPNNLVRFVFHHLMIFVGFLGVVKFCQDFSPGRNYNHLPILGGLFYILNFGTIQILGLPWDAFSVFFAFLPWEVWIFLRLLTESEHSKKSFILLFVINLLATPQSYIQTIFISYFLVLVALWFGLLLKNLSFKFLKKTLIIFGVILAVNLFWLLPQIYFLKTSSNIVTEAKANALSTDDLHYINDDKGDLFSFMKLQGFYYELRDSNQVFIFEAWKKYFQIFPVNMLPIILFMVAFLGFFFIPRFKLSFLLCWVIIGFALLSRTFPFSFLHNEIKQNILISQIFRSPFTKFIIPHVFLLSYFFYIGINVLIDFLSRKTKLAKYLSLPVVVLLLITYFPAFSGNFFAQSVKVTIPNSYFELFDFFKTQDKSTRISLLPDSTFWGWYTNTWGYNGSGFLWYGIEQPIVSRNFDVWSDKSEGYYWEVKSALEAEDADFLKKIFDKYAIDFLIYDKSLLPIASSIKAMQYGRIDALLKKIPGVTLVKHWNYLYVYRISHQKNTINFIWKASSLPNIGPQVKFTNQDSAYTDFGDYQTNKAENYQAFYPFLDLFTQTKRFPHEWKLLELASDWNISRPLSLNLKDFDLIFESEVKEILTKENSAVEYSYPFSVKTNNEEVTIQFPKLSLSGFDLVNAPVINCGYGYGDIEKGKEKTGISLIVRKGSTACISLKDNSLQQQHGYLIKVENENKIGQRLLFYILDSTKEQSYLEDRLVNDTEYYILPPKYQYGLGYEFNFRISSYEKTPAQNSINNLSVYLFPYDKLKQMVFINKNSPPQKAVLNQNFTAKKYTYFLYEVSPGFKDSYIILNQAFHSGWMAFSLTNGRQIKDHILINNWANGWKINSNDGKIIIIFLPQLLEFFGFGILTITIYIIYACKLNAIK